MRQRPLALMLAVTTALATVGCGDDAGRTSTESTMTSTTEAMTTTTAAPTSSTTSTATSTTTSTGPSIEEVVFDADGLGVVDFGDEPGTALATLTEILGPPSFDTGWGDPSDPGNEHLWPGCPGTTARIVLWDDILTVYFTDWIPVADDPYAGTGTPLLAGAGIGPTSGPTAPHSPLLTSEGAAVGNPYGELVDVYGDRLTVAPTDSDALPGSRYFAIDGGISHQSPTELRGTLRYWPTPHEWPPPLPTEPDRPLSDDYVVVRLAAGHACQTL